jgi:hypothetical protein
MSKILELRNVWRLMIRRCESPKDTSFKDYGGRGIKICERWHNFDNFYADMGVRPVGMQIDRIDNNGNYEPGNVRWVTPPQQTRNKRNNVNLTFAGRTMCMQDWAVEIGISPPTLLTRLQRGWSVEQTLTTPAVRRANSDPGDRILTLNGKKRHLAEWARELGVNPAAILYRLNAGWSIKDALTTPKPERPNAKLNMRQARAIRALYPKLSADKIAVKYGVSKKTVLNIIHGRIFIQ